MKGVTFNCHFSIQSEVARIAQIYLKKDWYINHGYSKFLILPTGLTIESTPSLKVIEEHVVKEFNNIEYDQYSIKLVGELKKFIGNQDKTSEINFLTEYDIYITKYGTGGSYTPPNKITVNYKKNGSNFFTVLHEMIHLSIEDKVQKHGISQQQKERVVDLIGKKLFPDIAKEQQRFADQNHVDQAFADSYPDIDNIFAKIKGIPE